MSKVEPLIDEGLRISLVETAFFDGDIEIPHIDAPDLIVIPQGMVPFSQRERDIEHKSFVPGLVDKAKTAYGQCTHYKLMSIPTGTFSKSV